MLYQTVLILPTLPHTRIPYGVNPLYKAHSQSHGLSVARQAHISLTWNLLLPNQHSWAQENKHDYHFLLLASTSQIKHTDVPAHFHAENMLS